MVTLEGGDSGLGVFSCPDDEGPLTLDGANQVLEAAYAAGDDNLAAAAERVVQALSGVEGLAVLGDFIMVAEARA